MKDILNGANGPSPMMARPNRFKRAKPIGMGDFMQFAEPNQRHWESLPGNVKMPPPAVVATPPVPMDLDTVAKQQLQANQFAQAMGCQSQPVKRGNWVEPPSEAIMIDQSTIATGIAIPATGANTTILQITIPDRFYGVIQQFGHELETDVAFQSVQWRIEISGSPLPFSYYDGTTVYTGAFRAQLGKANTPSVLGMPIIAKYNDVIRLIAQSVNGAAHTAYARMTGWMYPVKDLDGAGAVNEPCQYTGQVPLLRGGATASGSGAILY